MTRHFTVNKEGLPSLPGMMLVTIKALQSLGGSASIGELDDKVIELEGLSEDEQSWPMSGTDNRLRANYYLAWARTYLRRGGALENSARAVWALTDNGDKITTIKQTQAIYKQVENEERERRRKKRLQEKGLEDSPNTRSNNHTLDNNIENNSTEWSVNLLNTLQQMCPTAFERLTQRLLREAGFSKVEVRGKSGDGGIDGVGILRVNLVSFQVYFQCKRYKNSVQSKEIRDFRGALQGRADKGLFITTGRFTTSASEEATRDGAIAIDLIDGERLCQLLKQYELGVHTKMIEEISIDKHWFNNV